MTVQEIVRPMNQLINESKINQNVRIDQAIGSPKIYRMETSQRTQSVGESSYS